MRRPLPVNPRGPGRRRDPAASPRKHLLAYPRVSPEWELGALRALMKPHDWTRGAIAHRQAFQPWSAAAARGVKETTAAVCERLNLDPPPLHFPDDGDFWFVIEADDARLEEMKALGLALSKRLPGGWLTLGRLYFRDGKFFRRKRDNTFKFRIVPSTSTHLTRPIRAALRGLV